MENYIVVLFKDKKKKRIIKKFITFSRAKQFYEKLIKESNEVLFEIRVEGGKECNYEIGIVEMSSKQLVPVYMTDEFGRNIKVKLENPDYNIIKISPYRYPETIFDIERNKKITVDFFLNRYLPKVGVKVMSVLNNKVIIQNDDEVRLFSLKSENEAERFIAEISSLFYKNKRGDCLFVTDTSSPQRKYLFQFLESKGFDKKILYRKFTTHPRHLRPK